MDTGNRWDGRRRRRPSPVFDVDDYRRRIVRSLYWTVALLAALALGAAWLFVLPT